MNKNHLESLKNEKEVFGRVKGDFFVKALWIFIY
jgi:hypothetical protein